MSINIRHLEYKIDTTHPDEQAVSLTDKMTPFLALKPTKTHPNYSQLNYPLLSPETLLPPMPLPTRPRRPLQDNAHD